ncbi:MATE family efflux transporter [Neiella marina]|uniref:MATE family efflux transporter n=1 Tax=Neiella holothuriorum TaxID=2870530 RepID=A0ABS7EH59_9GAMM|nr:MATE family efflux transporter [Neiella holothuriorum]MBW8191243.1 MATE family efflux transporter [Neiella holothuriorum]
MIANLIATVQRIELHRKVGKIAVPMILANLTVPLLGLVDTAVIGHLDEVYYLGGVAVGSMVVTLLYWLAGFLRMSTTGLAGQALGADDGHQQQQVLLQGLALAIGLGLLVVIANSAIWHVALALMKPSAQVAIQAQLYFDIRILSAPAALMNLVLMGWFIGLQRSRTAMALIILTNSVNIVLDLVFVLGFKWGVQGAALATVLADYSAAALALWLAWRLQPKLIKLLAQPASWLKWRHISSLVAMNRDIFIRSLSLQLCIAFMTAKAARLGDATIAANAVLMNFLMLIALGLDGIAYAAEAMVARAKGAKCRLDATIAIQVNSAWTLILALLFSAVFWLFGTAIISLLTDLAPVRETAQNFMPYIILLPLAGAACFLLDGVFIGFAAAKPMRNTMLVAAFGVFFPVWWLLQAQGNHALWIAFLCFLLARGIGLSVCLPKQLRQVAG